MRWGEDGTVGLVLEANLKTMPASVRWSEACCAEWRVPDSKVTPELTLSPLTPGLRVFKNVKS